MRSWLRPATASGSNWIEPSLRKTSSTASGPPSRDLAGARNCRATRKRRAAAAVVLTGRTLAIRTRARRECGRDLRAGAGDAAARAVAGTAVGAVAFVGRLRQRARAALPGAPGRRRAERHSLGR